MLQNPFLTIPCATQPLLSYSIFYKPPHKIPYTLEPLSLYSLCYPTTPTAFLMLQNPFYTIPSYIQPTPLPFLMLQNPSPTISLCYTITLPPFHILDNTHTFPAIHYATQTNPTIPYTIQSLHLLCCTTHFEPFIILHNPYSPFNMLHNQPPTISHDTQSVSHKTSCYTITIPYATQSLFQPFLLHNDSLITSFINKLCIVNEGDHLIYCGGLK